MNIEQPGVPEAGDEIGFKLEREYELQDEFEEVFSSKLERRNRFIQQMVVSLCTCNLKTTGLICVTDAIRDAENAWNDLCVAGYAP